MGIATVRLEKGRDWKLMIPTLFKGHIRYCVCENNDRTKTFLVLACGECDASDGVAPPREKDKPNPYVAVELYDRSIDCLQNAIDEARRRLHERAGNENQGTLQDSD